MISMQVYPVMDGLEVWVAASCHAKQESHFSHSGDSVCFYVGREDIDRHGSHGAIIRSLDMVLSENPTITERYHC